jgi:hypothetical protein
MIVLNELTGCIFVGFAIFTLLTSFVKFPTEAKTELVKNLTDTAVMVVRAAALIYLSIWLITLYIQWQSDEENYTMITRLTGPYWFSYLMYPFSFGLFPQLLWINPIKKIKAIRIIASLLFLFIGQLEKITIMITSLHRDYVPSSWSTYGPFGSYYQIILYNTVVQLICFAVILTIVHISRLKPAKRP